jgi:hypothetical protein
VGWLARARKPAARKDGAHLLTHPPTTLVVGAVCTGLFGAITVVVLRIAKPDQHWTVVIFLGFAALGAVTIVEAMRVRHELTSEGIAYRGLWRRYASVPWGDIASVRWSPGMKWLVLTTRDGRTMRFSGLLNGLDALAVSLRRHAPNLAADPITEKVLSDARAGTLPSVWE